MKDSRRAQQHCTVSPMKDKIEVVHVGRQERYQSDGQDMGRRGIARIFSGGGALFSSKKLTTFFSRRPQNTG